MSCLVQQCCGLRWSSAWCGLFPRVSSGFGVAVGILFDLFPWRVSWGILGSSDLFFFTFCFCCTRKEIKKSTSVDISLSFLVWDIICSSVEWLLVFCLPILHIFLLTIRYKPLRFKTQMLLRFARLDNSHHYWQKYMNLRFWTNDGSPFPVFLLKN